MMRFTIQEIIIIALQIEIKGREFYLKYAAKTNSAEIKKIFNGLALAESMHERIYNNMLHKLPKQKNLDFLGNNNLYLRAFGQDSIFLEDITTKNFLNSLKSDKAAVAFGLEREKATVVFYQKIKQFLNFWQGLAVNKIIREEKKHVQELSRILKKLD